VRGRGRSLPRLVRLGCPPPLQRCEGFHVKLGPSSAQFFPPVDARTTEAKTLIPLAPSHTHLGKTLISSLGFYKNVCRSRCVDPFYHQATW